MLSYTVPSWINEPIRLDDLSSLVQSEINQYLFHLLLVATQYLSNAHFNQNFVENLLFFAITNRMYVTAKKAPTVGLGQSSILIFTVQILCRLEYHIEYSSTRQGK